MTEAQESYVSDRYDAYQDTYNTIAYRLDPSQTLEIIRRTLKNEYLYDADKDQYYRPKGLQPKFDEIGIEELMLLLKSRMSVDKVLGNLESNELLAVERRVGETVLEFIYMKGDKYNIKESDYSDIFYMIWDNVKIFISRAKKGLENELISKGFIHREVVSKSGHTTEDNTPQQSPYFMFGRRK